MSAFLSTAIWLMLGAAAVRNWSTQTLVRGVISAVVATLINSAMLAGGVSLQTMFLIAGPVVEEGTRTLAARKSRDFTIADVVIFAMGFVLVELFVKVTRQLDGQTAERVLAILVSGTRALALHLVTTLLLAYGINRSRDLLKSWPIWTAFLSMVVVHAVFNLLVSHPRTAGFFGIEAGVLAPFAYIAVAVAAGFCWAALAQMRPR